MTTFSTSAPVATFQNLEKLSILVTNSPARGAWSRGVRAYAHDIINNFFEWAAFNEDNGEPLPVLDEKTALNGANNWKHYSEGGCGLIYSYSIAERLFNASEFKKFEAGKINDLDIIACEGRALFQAWQLVASFLPRLS